MKRKNYTGTQLAFLKRVYLSMTVEDLTAAFNNEFREKKTVSAIRSALKNHKITCGREPGARLYKNNRLRIFTPEQAEFVRRNYSGRSGEELTALFNETFGENKTLQQIRTFVHNRGIVSGRTGHFEKGNTPHNKGIKGWDSGGRSKETRFKPGQRGSKWVPVGSHRITKDGIVQEKVKDSKQAGKNWKSVHEVLWEKHNGPVPKGHIVIFKDGDSSYAGIRIDNLECISRAENMRRNSIHNLPEDLVDVIRIRGVLNRHINKRSDNEKQDRRPERSSVLHHRSVAR